MRALSGTLLAEQRDKNVSPYISITLVAPGGSPTYTYTTADATNRIFKIDSTEALFGSTAQTTIQLKNDDQFFSAKDLRGYKVTLGWGCVATGNEKSDAAPLWVRSHRDRSEEGVLLTEFVCVDAWWKLAQLDVIGGGVELRGTIVGTFRTGEAVTNGGQGGGTGVALRVLLVGADFITVTGVTGTFLTSDVVTGSTSFATITLTQAGTTGGGIGSAPSFGNATIRNILASLVADIADMVDDTAGNDTLLDGTSDYEPSNFDSILGLVKRFEEMTNSVLVYKADGKMHLTWLNPAPAAYDYEYDSVHCFIIDYRERVLVIPNKVFVIAELGNAASTWAVANDTTSQAAIGVVSKVYEDPDVAGNAPKAQLRANALLFRLQQEASKGRALVSMNCGQEVMDYVLITDSRAATTITGRIGMLTRHYASGTYSMEIALGEAFDFLDVESPQSFLDSLQTYGYGRLMVPGGVITGPLSSPSVSLDASQIPFTPATLGNWTSGVDPGQTDDALDQLASRAKSLETAPPAHVLLSTAHSDTLAGSVLDGDVIIGNVTPKWSRLAISIPAANVRNLLGIDNAELRPSWKTALDATNPANIAAAASPGTSLVFAHRDHVHAHPDLGDLHTGYLTPAEHTAIGDAAPHHAAVTLAADAGAVLGLTGQEVTLDSQDANKLLAGPVSGAAADPTFRALVEADIPDETVTSRKLAPTIIEQRATDTTLINSAVETDLIGASISVTPAIASMAVVLGSVDCDGDTANDIYVFALDVDGTNEGAQILYQMSGVTGVIGDRKLLAQHWLFPLTAAAHTIKLQGYRVFGTGTCKAWAVHSKLILLLVGDNNVINDSNS